MRDLDALARENEQLREMVAYLRRALGDGVDMPRHWGLSDLQSRYVALMFRRRVVSKEMLAQGVYGVLSRDEPDSNGITAIMSAVRKRLRAHGADVITRWGIGWELDDAAREAIALANRPLTDAA